MRLTAPSKQTAAEIEAALAAKRVERVGEKTNLERLKEARAGLPFDAPSGEVEKLSADIRLSEDAIKALDERIVQGEKLHIATLADEYEVDAPKLAKGIIAKELARHELHLKDAELAAGIDQDNSRLVQMTHLLIQARRPEKCLLRPRVAAIQKYRRTIEAGLHGHTSPEQDEFFRSINSLMNGLFLAGPDYPKSAAAAVMEIIKTMTDADLKRNHDSVTSAAA